MYVSDALYACTSCLLLLFIFGFFPLPLKESIVDIKTETQHKRRIDWNDLPVDNILIKTTLFVHYMYQSNDFICVSTCIDNKKNKKPIIYYNYTQTSSSHLYTFDRSVEKTLALALFSIFYPSSVLCPVSIIVFKNVDEHYYIRVRHKNSIHRRRYCCLL